MSLRTRDPSVTSSKVRSPRPPPSYPILPTPQSSAIRALEVRDTHGDSGADCLDPGILHTIFFHRFFPSLVPRTREVLDLTLPYVDDDELETMIEQRASALERQLDAQRTSGSAGNGGGRGQLVVQFFEKRRRNAWLSRGDEEVCWECWTVKVTVAEPRTESGAYCPISQGSNSS